MKRFELTLVDRDENRQFHARSIDKVEADDLVSLLSQFMIVIASIHRRMLEDVANAARVINDDDIPF